MKKHLLFTLIALVSMTSKAQSVSIDPVRATNTLQWCGSFDSFNIFGGSASYQVAALWNAEDLVSYKDWYVDKISFMPTEEECEYTLMAWDGETGQEILTSTVANNSELYFMEKSTVKLKDPVRIGAGKSYYFGIGIKTSMGKHPLGQDKGPAIQGKGDLFRLTNASGQASGDFFSLASVYPQIDCNWLLVIHLTSETGLSQALENKPVVSIVDGMIQVASSARELLLFDMKGQLLNRKQGSSIEAPAMSGQYLLLVDGLAIKLSI